MINNVQKLRIILVGMIVVLLFNACIIRAQGVKQVRLIVSAAASLQVPLETISQMYKKENPGVRLNLNFAASGTLRQQIEAGAPADLFIPAAERDMEQLQAKGLILETTRKNLLKNKLVLIVSKKGVWIQSFTDLASKRLTQVAVGNPVGVPAGMYSQETLTYLGIWKKVESKAVYAKDVKQIMTWVATGNIDAGLVYSTDAKQADTVKVVAVAPEQSHAPIIYPAAVVKASLYPREAAAFLRYLDSAKANRIFLKAGFSLGTAVK